MCMSDICSWGTNYTFLQLPPSKVFITIWVPKWGQFWGDQLWIWIQIQIQSTFWPEFRVHSGSSSGPIYVSPKLIVVVGEPMQLQTPVTSLSHLSFWPEFRRRGIHPSSGSGPICLTWAYCGRVYSRKIWSQLHFFVNRNLSAVHDWIGLLPLDCQWAKKVVRIYIYLYR